MLFRSLITRDMIAQVAGDCQEYVYKDGMRALSPGMKYKHYSPVCRTVLFSYNEISRAEEEYKTEINKGVKAFILCDGVTAEKINAENVLNLGKTESEIAANLYSKLREGEEKAELIIAVAPEKQDGIMVGVMNRLSKACAKG